MQLFNTSGFNSTRFGRVAVEVVVVVCLTVEVTIDSAVAEVDEVVVEVETVSLTVVDVVTESVVAVPVPDG
jgi:hypothetical protein